jgi:putative hydrolase of the HAD superfamily
VRVLTTVVFDVDETLVATRAAVEATLAVVVERVRRRTDRPLTVAQLRADWADTFAAMASAPVPEIRRAALARSLARVGLLHELDGLTEFFFTERLSRTRPFDDVLPALAALRGGYRLGLATNGNSRADRCGLADLFDFEVYAHHNGVPKKPDPGFYAAVARAAGLPPEQIIHIGDNPEHDVAGAAAAGMTTVWLNRAGVSYPGRTEPHATVGHLGELADVLSRITKRPRSIP